MRTPTTFLLLITATFGDLASGFPVFGSGSQDLDKRWYSISGLWPDKAAVAGTWPVLSFMPGIHQLRCCYDKQEDYDRLGPIMDAAKPIWAPALSPNSALKLVPEQGTDEKSICSTDPKVTSPDTMRLQYHPRDIHCQGIGYNKRLQIKADKHQKIADTELHKIVFTMKDSEKDGKGKTTKVGDGDRVRLAHELGHAMGLDHEFQRPDADKYIKVTCANLKEYAAVKAQIDAKSGKWQKGDTIEKACTDVPTATRYGFDGALQNIRGPTPSGAVDEKSYSIKFDYNSIMMYGSYQGSREDVCASDFPNGAVMLIPGYTIKHKFKKDEVVPPKQVYMGGKTLPRYVVAVSAGDVARIQQLYPLGGGAVSSKPEKGDWGAVLPRIHGGGPA